MRAPAGPGPACFQIWHIAVEKLQLPKIKKIKYGCFSLYPDMSGYKLKRSSAKKRDFELLPISVCQRSWLTETACGRPQGSLADLRRYAARRAFARRTDDLANHQ